MQADQQTALIELARRCLWLAFCWNDHNFGPAHEQARKEAAKHGIGSMDEANVFLENVVDGVRELPDGTVELVSPPRGEVRITKSMRVPSGVSTPHPQTKTQKDADE